MLFHAEEFRQAVNDNHSKSIMLVISKLMYSLKNDEESIFMVRMVEEVTAILKGQS
jgi:hypothetical protein